MNNSPPKNILMLNLTRMGDLIQSTPLLKGLRNKYPESKITLLVGSDFYEFSKRLPCVDEWIVLDLRQFKEKSENSGISWVEIYKYFEQTLNQIKKKNFDYVFNLSHSKLSAFIISYLKIPNIRGFKCNKEGDRMTEHPWLQYFFTEPFNRPYNTFNLVDLFSLAGDVSPSEQSVELKTDPEDQNSADLILENNSISSNDILIGFQAGSSLEGRRWPPNHFAKLGDLLVKNLNARILLFGVNSEAAVGDTIVRDMENSQQVVNLIGKTGIGELTGLVKRCNYLVTNDTGTMHIAAAHGTNIVGLFFAHAHPQETGPYSENQLLFQADIPCAPCSYGVNCNNVVCIEKLSPELVSTMIQDHSRNNFWKLPSGQDDFSELNIYVTERGTDQCLRMKPLIKKELNLNVIFSWIYRRLWLDTLGKNETVKNFTACEKQIDFIRKNYKTSVDSQIGNELGVALKTLAQIEQFGLQGARVCRAMIKELDNGIISPGSLGKMGNEITKIDENINLNGLTHPELKPVTDMFNKRKENIEGEQIRLMAGTTLECYEQLVLECRHLAWLAGEFKNGLNIQAACEDSEESSISIQVPGR